MVGARCDFDNSAVSNEEVDAKLDAWEEQGARIRKEARRLQQLRSGTGMGTGWDHGPRDHGPNWSLGPGNPSTSLIARPAVVWDISGIVYHF